MDQFAKWVLALVFIFGGLIYAVLRVLADIDGDPNMGPFGGWGPVFAGLGAVALGILLIIF